MTTSSHTNLDQNSTPLSSSPRALQVSSLTADLEHKIEEVITHYPVSKRSAALPILHLWQKHFGFIDDSGVAWIAAKLDLEPIAILELVTFYPWFRQTAPGKKILRICRTLSCAMQGSYELYHHACEHLHLDPKQAHHGSLTTEDGEFTVEFVECLASCGTAPVCMVNDDLVEEVTLEKLEQIIQKKD